MSSIFIKRLLRDFYLLGNHLVNIWTPFGCSFGISYCQVVFISPIFSIYFASLCYSFALWELKFTFMAPVPVSAAI